MFQKTIKGTGTRKVNAKANEVSRMNGNKTPVQEKKKNEYAKFESAQKAVETKGQVKKGLGDQFLKKLMLRRKFLIRTLTTRMTGEQNASDQELNHAGPPHKKTKSSSDALLAKHKMQSPKISGILKQTDSTPKFPNN